MKKITYIILGVFVLLILALILFFQLTNKNLDKEIIKEKQNFINKSKLEELLPISKNKNPEDLYKNYTNL